MVNWIYVFECEDDYIYVGKTIHLFTRFNSHQSGRGAVNTGKHMPLCLIGLYRVAENLSFKEYNKIIINENRYEESCINNWGQDNTNYLDIENLITERFFHERRDNSYYGGGEEWYKVRGGKYTYNSLDDIVNGYKQVSENPTHVMYWNRTPIYDKKLEEIVDRPLCNHGYPSEVKLSQDKKTIYFICSMKNVWKKFNYPINRLIPCDFYKRYDEDAYIKKAYELSKTKYRQ